MPELQRGGQRGHLAPGMNSYIGSSEYKLRERERKRHPLFPAKMGAHHYRIVYPVPAFPSMQIAK